MPQMLTKEQKEFINYLVLAMALEFPFLTLQGEKTLSQITMNFKEHQYIFLFFS